MWLQPCVQLNKGLTIAFYQFTRHQLVGMLCMYFVSLSMYRGMRTKQTYDQLNISVKDRKNRVIVIYLECYTSLSHQATSVAGPSLPSALIFCMIENQPNIFFSSIEPINRQAYTTAKQQKQKKTTEICPFSEKPDFHLDSAGTRQQKC